MPYVVEVDQSGKIEQTSWDTALAFSDGLQGSIIIPAGVKRSVFDFLRQKYPERAGLFHLLQFFAVGLYLLLCPYLDQLTSVTIDLEYSGNEGYIKGVLLNYLRRENPSLPSDLISFGLVGEESPADRLAKSVFRGEKEPNRVITLEEILKVLK
jgi:hypothetical protein